MADLSSTPGGDITGIASSSSSSSSTSHGHVYDIFLNHRGEKKNLARDMYRRLTVRELRVFFDERELEKGEDIPSQLKEAIQTASVHVAIFSPAYARSRWCLDELALMVESGSTIIPVFIDVEPTELRWTWSGDGRYAQALQILENKTTSNPHTNEIKPRYDSTTLQKWRNALSVVSYKSGFVMDAYNGDESLLVDAVVEEVSRKVPKTPLDVAKYPTGLSEKIEVVKRMVSLQQQSQATRVVGIVGLGGIGKTTLAKQFFNIHRSNYKRSCFLADVRETTAKSSLSSLQATLLKDLAHLNVQISNTHEGIGELRKHLSSSPSSLIVLDDVDHIDQLDALFSPVKDSIQSNSLILVTSRNKDLLTSAGIAETTIYKQKGLNLQHSRQLFCSHAFDQTCPNFGFEQLVEDFLVVCDGLPLSLKVIGALIRGKDLEYWKAQFHKIHRIVPTDIQSRLKSSYDGLDKEEQEIFLDIACFFIGENRDTAITIWNGSGWAGWLGLRNLENRCLVEVDSENCIRMDDHLRDLGRDLAEKQHPAYQLRLSRPNVNLFLSPLSPVRGISMYGNDSEQFFQNIAGNYNLSRLQLLMGQGSFVESVFSAWELRQLIYLRWEECPISSICLPIQTMNLRVLYIQGRKLKTLWQHESQAPLQLRELYIDAPLSEVPESIGTLNLLQKIVLENSVFKTLPNVFCQRHCLKYISLKNCREMMLLPDSVGFLTALQTLDLWGCYSLQELPDSVGQLTALQTLHLRGCSSLRGLPDSVGQLTGLQSLDLESCSSLQGLPDSVGQLTGLQSLDLCWCSSLQGLPDSVGQLTGLQSINLERCSSLQGLTDSVGQLTGLQSINLRGCSSLQGLPDSVGQLTSLQSINLRKCSSLHGLPDSVGQLTGLQSLDLPWCSSLQGLPDSVGQLMGLQRLDLRECFSLQGLPDSVGQLMSLQSINLRGCSSVQGLPDSVGQLTGLQSIDLQYCSSLQGLPDSVGQLTGLQSIDLRGCASLQGLPGSVGQLTGLQSINLERCSSLQGLPDSVGQLTGLQSINLQECSSLQGLPDSVGQLMSLQSINLRKCSSLHGLPDSVGQLTGLQSLDLPWCSSLQGLPDSVGQLTDLQRLDLRECFSLHGLPDSVGQLTSLQSINLRGCSSVQGLPDSVGRLTGLQSIDLQYCSSLQGLPDSVGQMTGLQSIYLQGCASLQGLPDSVGQLTGLQSIYLRGCSSLQGLPDSVGQLTGLQSINLWECSSLQGLPDSVGQLTGLQSIDLESCSSLQGLPDSVGQLTGLQSIYLRGCSSLQGLPDSVGQLKGLQSIDLEYCSSLEGLPDSVGQLTGLQSIYLRGCSNLQGLPDSVGQLTGLQSIDLQYCSSLQELPKSVGNLRRLKRLYLSGCSNLQMLPNVQHLSSLKILDVSECSKLQWGAGIVEKLRQRLGRNFIEEHRRRQRKLENSNDEGSENSNDEGSEIWEEGSENIN